MSRAFKLPSYAHRRWRPFRKKGLMELFDKTKSGCWVWKGSVHTRGNPIYLGWEYATRAIYEQVNGSGTLTDKRIAGQFCGNRLCVNPVHQIVILLKMDKENEPLLDLSTKSLPGEAEARARQNLRPKEARLFGEFNPACAGKHDRTSYDQWMCAECDAYSMKIWKKWQKEKRKKGKTNGA